MLLFSYGSNLSKDQFARRCPTAKLVGVARLKDHRLTFTGYSGGWGGAVATVMPAEGVEVPGAVYELRDPDDVRTLDRCEGFPRVYDCVEVEVLVRRGKRGKWRKMPAWTYVKVNQTEGQPSNEYVKTIAKGLKEHGLTVEHLAEAIVALPPAKVPAPRPKKRKGKGKKAPRVKWRKPQKAQTVYVRPCVVTGCAEELPSGVCYACGSSRPHCRQHCREAKQLYSDPSFW